MLVAFRILRILFILVISFSTLTAQSEPITYTISTQLSRVTFHIEHQGFIDLVGTLRVAPGVFVFDNDDWTKSSAAIVMTTRSIDLGDAFWNSAVRKDESWANLFKYPAISFKSTGLMKSDATHGKMFGELTLAGVTKSIELDLKVNKIGINQVSEFPSVGFSASTSVKRSEFGLDAYEDLVGDTMGIQIEVEAFVGKDPGADHDQAASGSM